ncbi:hypothetical protein RHMOL_Rhmol12G0062100 [Rhododendron molle]|uniref:Uncharacterized protein n=1 Tax=Rhododendron molle TaxID=49168 RepID=A0ACC0LGI5_RHOML|nr:hypothetical protein RHMOL_Rhmol12G0062100 [Rhododendron molle]
MEFFNNTKAVRLRSSHNKYLVADDDKRTVRQSRNESTRKARWIVEPVDDNPQAIRLKSVHGGYLTASSALFLLGFTGNKVLQTQPDHPRDLSIEWAPVLDGSQVRLVTAFGGTCLRANGGTPPWKNSVTHDVPSAKRSWILWEVEAVEIPENEELTDGLFRSEVGSPVSLHSSCNSPMVSIKKNNAENALQFSRPPNIRVPSNNKIQSVMKVFHNAKTVRLRSNHNKYLCAEGDEISVTQDESSYSKNVRWTVEFSSESENKIRLKSCYGKYLTASNKRFLLGWTGRKALQMAGCLDSSVEWQPIQEGNQVKLRTRDEKFLRANSGVPPWRDSVTHDIPNRTATQDWVLWDVDVVEIVSEQSSQPKSGVQLESRPSSESNHRHDVPSIVRQESNDSGGSLESKAADGRVIYYSIADEYSNVDEDLKELSFMFKGNGVQELTKRLQEETGLEDIIVCSRSSMNTLYTLRSKLPPNNVDMHVVVVPSSSRGQ